MRETDKRRNNKADGKLYWKGRISKKQIKTSTNEKGEGSSGPEGKK